MKRNIFSLTKSEQRVVILMVMALLIGAFVRYWRDVNEQKKLNQMHPTNADATPFASPRTIPTDMDEDADSAANNSQTLPSPQSSP